MVVVSLDETASVRAGRARKRAVCENDHDQARRENDETETGHAAN
jgi:hypothetical protein